MKKIHAGGIALLILGFAANAGWTAPAPGQAAVPGQEWTVPDIFLQMGWIAPGTFTMGSPENEAGRGNDEVQHQVRLTSGYWIGRYPVTTYQWAMAMGNNPSHDNRETGEAPVDTVSWNEAMAFCQKLTEAARKTRAIPAGYEYTLPTEAQWEYASRAGATGARGGDGGVDDMCWYSGNSGGHKHPVGQKKPNAWGLFDMNGNIAEWCWDWYGQYPRSQVTDPRGPEFGSEKVFRGGSYRNFAAFCRAAYRYGHQVDEKGASTGFRLALAPVASPAPTIARAENAPPISMVSLWGDRMPTAGSASRSFAAPADLPRIAEMPDPRKDAAGQTATTPEQWARRRAEMRAIIQHYYLGQMPPPPGQIGSEVIRTETVLNGLATYRLVRLRFGPGLELLVAVYLPADATRPLPFFIFPTFSGTPGLAQPTYALGPDATIHHAPGAEEFARQRIDVLRRGYGLLTYDYQEAGLDNCSHDENRQSGFFPAYPGYDWGAIAAWAWSISRCVDYLSTQSFSDPARIALTGHSRLGKTTLVAAAFDDRITLAIPTGSGCGGTGSYRVNSATFQCQNGIETTTVSNPSWYNRRFWEFFGHVDQLPFDQNWLAALVAPRPLLFSEAYDDLEATPRASLATYQATMPIYAWLHASDKLGIHFRPGGHDDLGLGGAGGGGNDDNWQTALDFADHHFLGLAPRTDFHRVPEAASLK